MAEIDLNNLTVKTDSLPDNWKMLLIDPVTLQPAQNITVARFVELLTGKIPLATNNSNGLCSYPFFRAGIFEKGIIGDYPNTPGKIKDFNLLSQGLYGVYKPGDDIANSPKFTYGIVLVLETMGFVVQLGFSSDNNIYYRIRTDALVWISWRTIQFNSASYTLYSNQLTDTVSNSYSLTPPPPRKLRAKLFKISQFGRAICESGCTGYRQPRWLNSS